MCVCVLISKLLFASTHLTCNLSAAPKLWHSPSQTQALVVQAAKPYQEPLPPLHPTSTASIQMSSLEQLEKVEGKEDKQLKGDMSLLVACMRVEKMLLWRTQEA